MLHNALHDLRYAARQLLRSPGFTLAAVLTLALGIGANSTILSWINSTLLDPIPGVARTGRMVTIMRGERSEHPTPPLSYPDFADLRANSKSFSGMIAEHQDYISITGGDKPQRIYGELASADYFETLGVKPYLGSTLISTRSNERAGAPIAVLSYDLWQTRFAGDPAIIGKTIQLNLHPYTIAGVAPRGFRGIVIGSRTDIFLPVGMMKQVWGWDPMDERGSTFLNVLGVLRPGADARQATEELNVEMRRLVAQYPNDHPGPNQISTDPLWRSPFGVNVYLAGTLPILLALAAVLLLLACANVANLLLVRSVSRRREFAIRVSMGAGRASLVRQLMIENTLIALAGGGVALACSLWTAKMLAALVPPTSLPITMNGSVDLRVMMATILISLLTAVISGIVPALRAANIAPVAILKEESLNTAGGLHKSRLASALVVTQVALSLLMLVCAGLFLRSLENAEKSNPGFDPSHVLLMNFDLYPLGYGAQTGIEFQRQVLDRVRQIPGVESAALADFSPLSFTIHSDGELADGYVPQPHEDITADRGDVTPGYLATMHTRLVAGRDFTDRDGSDSQPVAIVNEAFVRRYWPGQNAVGRHVFDGHRWRTVVGVVENAKYRRLVYDPAPLVLMPMGQRYDSEAILHVRTNGEPMAFAAPVESAIHELNANLPVYNVTSLEQSMRMGSVFERIAVVLAGAFGLLALILASVGIYAVVAYTTRQRTHEIGIRMALGADRANIFSQVMKQGAQLALAGVVAGVAASLFLTRFLRSLLVGVAAADWITFASVAFLLSAVALLACYLPARRAASVDPMQALRTE